MINSIRLSNIAYLLYKLFDLDVDSNLAESGVQSLNLDLEAQKYLIVKTTLLNCFSNLSNRFVILLIEKSILILIYSVLIEIQKSTSC